MFLKIKHLFLINMEINLIILLNCGDMKYLKILL